MAFVTRLILRPLIWCIWFIIGALATTITATVARLECKKRRLESTIFVSRNLKITSAVSIGCGLMTTVLLCLELLPGSCILQYSASVIVLAVQFVSMGLYQLSRLYYCFSKTSTHHQNGYSTWIILTMAIVAGTILISCIMLFTLGHPLPSTCGFQSDLTFEWKYKNSAILFDGVLEAEELGVYHNRWFMANAVTFQLWDLTILLLYCHKVRRLKRACTLRRDAIWRKIMFILQRIIVITVFYWISFMTLNAVRYNAQIFAPKLIKYTLYNVVIALWAILYSMSTYLMMEHNTNEYVRFLRCLKKSYLKYIYFCCCHRMVDRQLTEFESRELPTKLEVAQLHVRQSVTSTWFPNISENVKYSRKHTMNVNVSIPTMTREAAD